jgi:two-component system cell cycle sensor histidine kinase/response regulator CckA
VVRLVTSTLAHAGFRVVVAENGIAGLDLFLSMPDEIDLVLTDIVMPIMDGITMAQEIRKTHPDTRIMVMTAYSDVVVQRVNPAKLPMIRKPFLAEDLIRIVTAHLDPPTATA